LPTRRIVAPFFLAIRPSWLPSNGTVPCSTPLLQLLLFFGLLSFFIPFFWWQSCIHFRGVGWIFLCADSEQYSFQESFFFCLSTCPASPLPLGFSEYVLFPSPPLFPPPLFLIHGGEPFFLCRYVRSWVQFSFLVLRHDSLVSLSFLLT